MEEIHPIELKTATDTRYIHHTEVGGLRASSTHGGKGNRLGAIYDCFCAERYIFEMQVQQEIR
jgi:hypothetical protein